MTNKTISFTIAIFVLVTCIASAGIASKIKPWVDANTVNGRSAEFFIVMKEKADLSPASKMATKIERGKFVYNTLYQTAQKSQGPLQQLLKSRGIKFQSFYIINAILVTGDRKLVNEMAARDDVASIDGNPVIHNDLPKPEKNGQRSPETIEWNITKVNAPTMWGMGFTGQGIVVGGMDTGYRWTHQALKSKYRGWDGTNANHDYNWHDSIHSGGGICGADSPVPCDDFFHGTHTMGTVVGDDGGSHQIGMAPGAKWIGCRNMDQGNGTPARYLECFEFMMAPYPVGGDPGQGDPSLAPDLTTNSWSCTDGEGCTIGDELQAAVDAQKAAGIMTVAAAQNQGPSCGTVDFPPGTYGSAYTVGSTTINDALSSFSSRGPADFTGLMKPSIVAPGSNVNSATNDCDTCYAPASGTSMATPNVAGGVALMWSAAPSYRNDQNSTETLMNNGATRLPAIVEACGGDYVNGPNNSWGYGLENLTTTYNNVCTPPAVPQNLASSVTGNNEVSLTWDSVPSATAYIVFRGPGSCPNGDVGFTQIAVSNTNSYLDTTVPPGTFSYKVSAIIGSCASAQSNCTEQTVTCGATLNPTGATYTAAGGSGTFDVTTGAGCDWTAVSNDSWIHVTSGGSGTGNGTVGYTVDANSGGARTGTITASGQTFTVDQDASACSFCDDFEDGVLDPNWTYIKQTWTESGGDLIGTPSGRKAVTVATPIFAGCLTCTVQTKMLTNGGAGNRVWLLGWYVDKANTIELMMKQETGRWVLKQRSGKKIVAKQKAVSSISVGVVYTVVISYNGTQFDVTVDGTPLMSLTPVGTVPTGTVGFQVKSTTGQFGEISVN